MSDATTLPIEDYQWLVSAAAQLFLADAVAVGSVTPRFTKSLRKSLTAERTHLVLEQAELRRRARVKFLKADQMFFTKKGLEQSTSETVARYKASRFPTGERVVDLCCGIGGDLMALAERGEVVGVERDLVAALFAQANCEVNGLSGVTVQVGDATKIDLKEFTAWHLDPDRRSSGSKTTKVEYFEPSSLAIEQFACQNENGIIKLAPASSLPENWIEQGARQEWIGHLRECKQQLAAWGKLAIHATGGTSIATVVSNDGSTLEHHAGEPSISILRADAPGRFIYDPHSSVVAARLVGSLAAQYELAAFSDESIYLTGEVETESLLLSRFEVIESMKYDKSAIRRRIKEMNVGHLEIKQRGVEFDATKELAGAAAGDPKNVAVLFVARLDGRVRATIARRCEHNLIG